MSLAAELGPLVANVCGGKPGAERDLERFARRADDPAVVWRLAAVRFAGAGRYDHAARAQERTISLLDAPSADDRTFLADMLLHSGQISRASTILTEVIDDQPGFLAARLKLAMIHATGNKFGEAAALYRAILADHPGNAIALDGLARAAGWIGAFEEAREAGRRSLETKDRAVSGHGMHWQVSDTQVQAFDRAARDRNIIAYSLWGSEARYIDTLTANIDIAVDLYPSWRCRVYCDRTVPSQAMSRMRSLGAQIVLMPTPSMRHAALMWRFLAADDADVDRVLFRDADSPLTVRERVAVDEWLASDKPFHLMRDWWSHTDLMLAGMWGAQGRVLSRIKNLMEAYIAKVSVPDRTIDQHFLASVVWPSIREHTLIHDDLFGVLGAHPFPPYGKLPRGHHVGMNISAVKKRPYMIKPRHLTAT